MTAATIDRATLADALTWVSKAVPVRPAVPTLAGVRVAFTDGYVTLAGFDYETSHVARLPAMVTELGDILVPAHLAAQMVASLRGDTVHLDPGGTAWGLTLRAGRSTFNLPGLPLDDYPALPDAPPRVGQVGAGLLASIIGTVAHAHGRDDMLPVLTGVHLEGDTGHTGRLVATSTDRFRIARRGASWHADSGFTALVPGRRLEAAVAGLTGKVEVGHRPGSIRFTTDERSVTIRTLEGEFPKMWAFLTDPHDSPTQVDVDVDELRSALNRASLALELNKAAGLRITTDTIEVHADFEPGAGLGAAVDVVDAKVTGDAAERRPDSEPFEIGFNPRFLAESLAALGTRRALIGFPTTPGKPAVLVPSGPDAGGSSDNHLPDVTCVCMPRRAKP